MLAAACALMYPSHLTAQNPAREWGIYAEHPRLFLNAQRLRLLRREKERTSQRWQQFEALMGGKAQMPEPGFANALYYQVTQDPAYAKAALQWAATPQADARQLALVYDWCQDVLTDAQKSSLSARLEKALEGGDSLPALRTRALAAIVLGRSEALAKIGEVWNRIFSDLVKKGKRLTGAELLAALELLHAVRDSTNNDLREDAPKYFTELARIRLLQYYPAAFPSAENDYRILSYGAKREPDLRDAVFGRAGELALVAFDRNATDHQFLQGWLNNDRFQMRGTLGVTYEYLWANPYQPGLTYQSLPLHYYDAGAGLLLVRSSWDEDATWFGLIEGKPELFQNGQRKTGAPKKLELGDVVLQMGSVPLRLTAKPDEPSAMYLLGMKRNGAYTLEVDDEEIEEVFADAAGTLAVDLKRTRPVEARLGEPFEAARSGR